LTDGSGSFPQFVAFEEGVEDLDDLLALRLWKLFDLAEPSPEAIVSAAAVALYFFDSQQLISRNTERPGQDRQ